MKKYLLNSFTVGIILTLISYFVYEGDYSILKVAEYKAYDFKVRLRGQRPVSGNVAIIAVDEKSLEEQGRWPWPRARLATLVDKLSEGGVAAIGFDILFPEPDTTFPFETFKNELKKKDLSNLKGNQLVQLMEEAANSDLKFADALANSERAILGYFVDSSIDNPMGKNIGVTA
jgi:adenylate cyclase